MRRSLLLLSAFVACLTGLAAGSPSAEAQRRIPINIQSTPSGATVFLDSPTGQALGTTPIRNVRVPRGSHTLIFRAENHEEARLPINVRRWRETFRAVLNPLSTIVVTAANDAANSAAVRIDGEPVGNIPFRGTVQPGRHLIQVGREGHVTFSQWVELAGAQVLTLPVMLEREAPQTGSLLVAADVSGAPVYLDGEPRGTTPTMIENVPAGEHQLEIRPEGMEVHRQTVRVIAGERLNVNPTLRPAPAQTGSLRVLANVPNATIRLDGEVIGQAPATADTVPPGEHILEATAEGYQTVQQPVTIESGQQRVVSLQLEADSRTAGRILVDATVGDALVTIDGEERGHPPVVIEDAAAGTHTISITAQGYEDFRTTCRTAPGRNCEIMARLQGVGTPVRVEAGGVRNAQLFIDGELVGPVPYEGNIPAGEHRLEVRAPGFDTHVQQINLQVSSTPRQFDVALVEEGDMSEEERLERRAEVERQRTGAVSHSAAPLPADLAILDISAGWPYLAELRLGVGILDFIEAGFAMRTFFRIFEFEGRAKMGVRPVEQLSFAAQARFGGGIGPGRDAVPGEMNVDGHDANTVFLSLEGLTTLHFSNSGAFTLWMGADFSSDQYDWWGRNSDCLIVSESLAGGESLPLPTSDEPGACMDDDISPESDPSFEDGALRDGRQNTARLRLGGALTLVINRNWNVWGLLEGILAGPPRDLYGDILGAGEDTELYLRLGLTHKF